jgi:hypothetical protein
MTAPSSLKSKSEAFIHIADEQIDRSTRSTEKAIAFATIALALEQRRTADALEAILEKLDLVVIDRGQGSGKGFVRIESESLGMDYW